TDTPGGNNGTDFEVTSLDDPEPDMLPGSGTLREALSLGDNHRIVFAVGGTIDLKSRLNVRDRAFITIDGSTAPPPGIALQGDALYVRNSNDIIVTHLRVRDSVGDGILIWDSSYNVVVDHCSVTDSADENVAITEDTSDVTVSWSIIGHTRPDSFTRRSSGMLIASFSPQTPVTRVSLHHNLFYNAFQRSPQISTDGLFDVRNNVIWNWGPNDDGGYGIRMRNGARGNIINNHFSNRSRATQNAVLLADTAGPVHIIDSSGHEFIWFDTDAKSTASSAFDVAPVTTTRDLMFGYNLVVGWEYRVVRRIGALPRVGIDRLIIGRTMAGIPRPRGIPTPRRTW
ncbi:MAG: right-handed parallel beta-helix repeat-containing protein, partial [Gammaproteobacteria bacterium]